MKTTHFIPQDLVINILLRLPLKSLFRFKAVCKTWNLVITSSSFVHARDAIAAGKLLCFYQLNDETPALSLFDPGEPNITDLNWAPFLHIQFTNKQGFLKNIRVIGPVHGIYCMYNNRSCWVNMVTLWNPATGHFKHIAPPIYPLPSELPTDIWCVGVRFGFDSTTNDFKLVLLCCWNDMSPIPSRHKIFKVYDMSTNSWKNTNHLDLFGDPNCNLLNILVSDEGLGDGCFVNGACHWPCSWVEKTANNIWDRGALAFNLATESFQLIKGPPNMSNCDKEISRWHDNQSLAMTIIYALPTCHLEVWLMRQYGMEDSWVMMYYFDLNGPIRSLGIPNDVLLLFRLGRRHVGSSILVRAYEAQGLPPPTSSDLERVVGVLKYEETLVGASIFNRHCTTETRKGKFAHCKRLCTRAHPDMPSAKKKAT